MGKGSGFPDSGKRLLELAALFGFFSLSLNRMRSEVGQGSWAEPLLNFGIQGLSRNVLTVVRGECLW